MADGTVDIRILIRGAREAVRQSRQVATGLDGVERSATKTRISSDKSRTSTEKMGKALKRAGMAAGIAAGALAAYGAVEIKKSITQTVDFAKETIKLQDALGGSAEDNSRLVAVFKSRGITTDSLFTATTRLSKAIGAAQEGTGSAADAFKAFGVSQDLIKKGAPIEVLKAISDGFKDLGPGFERTRRASELFGKGWMKLRPILKLGGSAIQEQIELAGKLGNKLTEKNLTDAGQFIKGQRDFQMAIDGLRVQLGIRLLPVLAKASKAVSEFLTAWADRKKGSAAADIRKWIEEAGKNVGKFFDAWKKGKGTAGDLRTTFTLIGKSLLWIINAGADVSGFFTRIYKGSGLVRTAVKAAMWVNPIYRFIKVVGFASKAFNKIKSVARSVKNSVVGTFNSMIGFFRKLPGKIGRAVSGAFNGLKTAFAAAGRFIQEKWNALELTLSGPKGIGKITIGTPDINIFRAGGRVPGTRTMADTIPAMLSPGEFVVTRSGEAMLDGLTGIPGVLNHVGKAQRSHFASGGRVAPMRSGAMQSSRPIITKVYLDRRQIAEAVGSEVSSRAARR